MSDTMDQAIRAAEAFLAVSRTPKQQGRRSTPSRTDEWLKWHRTVVARADGTRARLTGLRLKASSPEELERALALIGELQALADRAQVQADGLVETARL
jgi:hypothetical protein